MIVHVLKEFGLECFFICFSFHRGDTFRTVLTCVGELRSIIPCGIPVLALTATATKTLQKSVMSTIGMRCPRVVAINPCKSNIVQLLKIHSSRFWTAYVWKDIICHEY